jgi:two-component system chemotaxis sensor kinase CheA
MVDNFGGVIDVVSEPGKGTAFIIKLPLTLAIAKALIIGVGQRHFAIPTLTVERIVTIPATSIKKVGGKEVVVLDETDVPLLRLATTLTAFDTAVSSSDASAQAASDDLLAVIVEESGERIGLIIDTVFETSDIVIKPVPPVLKGVRGFSGVTILSDGKTALVINPKDLQ